MGQYNESPISRTAGEAIAVGLRVYLKASDGKVWIAGLNEEHMGYAKDEALAADERLLISLRSHSGTIPMVAAGAIAIGDLVYPAASGMVDDSGAGAPIGIALQAASGSGSIIEVAPFNTPSVAGGGSGGTELAEAAEDIAAGDLCYVSGRSGDNPTVNLAQGTIGGQRATHIAPNAIANGDIGVIAESFTLTGLNTSAAANVGQDVFLDDGTAGGWTLTQPTGTDFTQIVGSVAVDHASTGEIFFTPLKGALIEPHNHTDNSEGGTLTNTILTTPDINGGTVDSLTGFSIRSSGAAFDLEQDSSEVLTGNKIISWDVGDTDRAITLGGDIALGGTLTTLAAWTQTGAHTIGITTTGATAVTLPTTGVLSTLDGAETLTQKTITAPDINGGTADSLTNLSIRSSGAAFDLEFDTAEVLTGNHIVSWDVGDTDRAVTLGGDVALGGTLTTLAAWTQTGAHTLGITTTGATAITLPTTGTLATLAGAETLDAKTLTAVAGITMADSSDFVFNTGTGTEFGTATGQKFGFWNTTPTVQPGHNADPAACAAMTHSVGTGADGTTPSGSEYDKARADLDALKTAVDANKAAIDAINADFATLGLTAAV